MTERHEATLPRIRLLTQRPDVNPGYLRRLHRGPVVACDCYVQGAERWTRVPGGYQHGRLLNVDHHAHTADMAREISSANLAIERVREAGPPPEHALIVITHTDCDSILSAGIMSGRLAPDDRYGRAAVAADHTGDENAIADLLQSLDKRRDVELSLGALAAIEADRTLPPVVERALAERRRKRRAAQRHVGEGRIRVDGRIAYGELPESIDGEFFAPLLPDAWVILLAAPHPRHLRRREVKLRRGHAAPDGFSLHTLGVRRFDPAYGGRWNAGSNRRGGGTTLHPADYASLLRERVDALHALPATPILKHRTAP
jgi:hypothetical protein